MMNLTRVKQSPIHGKGLFANRKIEPKQVIMPIDGEIVLRRSKSRFAIWLREGQSLILAGKGRYVNHSSSPNAYFSLKKMAIIATQPIEAGDEITAIYESVF
jgi:uncharacterized protein